jgi:hypothetical protein
MMFYFIARSEEDKSTFQNSSYISFGGGVSLISVNEKINTCIPYTGISTGTDIEGVFGIGKSILQIKNVFAFGTLSPYRTSLPSKNTVNGRKENLRIAYLWNVYNILPEDFYLFAGPSIGANIGIRINNGEIANSSLTYEGAGNVSLAAKAIKYFNLNDEDKSYPKRFKLEANLVTSVFSKVYTPSYTGIGAEGLSEALSIIDINSNYFGSLHNYTDIETSLSLTYFLKNRNGLEFGYYCNYVGTKPKVNEAKNCLSLFEIKFTYNIK